jgi:hypothetical protein
MKAAEGRVALAGIALVAAIVLVAGLRVDTSVFVFALGFVCGAAFSVPLAIVGTLLVLQSREREERRGGGRRRRRETPAQPSVVVVQPSHGLAQLQSSPASWSGQDELPLAPARREFTVIGDDVLGQPKGHPQ